MCQGACSLWVCDQLALTGVFVRTLKHAKSSTETRFLAQMYLLTFRYPLLGHWGLVASITHAPRTILFCWHRTMYLLSLITQVAVSDRCCTLTRSLSLGHFLTFHTLTNPPIKVVSRPFIDWVTPPPLASPLRCKKLWLWTLNLPRQLQPCTWRTTHSHTQAGRHVGVWRVFEGVSSTGRLYRQRRASASQNRSRQFTMRKISWKSLTRTYTKLSQLFLPKHLVVHSHTPTKAPPCNPRCVDPSCQLTLLFRTLVTQSLIWQSSLLYPDAPSTTISRLILTHPTDTVWSSQSIGTKTPFQMPSWGVGFIALVRSRGKSFLPGRLSPTYLLSSLLVTFPLIWHDENDLYAHVCTTLFALVNYQDEVCIEN